MKSNNEQRKMDVALEQEAGKWMDKYFYGKSKGVKVERVHDKERQIKGIDVMVGNTKVDEKLKIRGLLNTVIRYPSFEVMRITRDGTYSEGWFVSSKMETDYYAFLSVFSSASSENLVNESNIEKVICLLVKKSEVFKAIGTSSRRLVECANELIDSFDERQPICKSAWLKITRNLREQPVNLVMTRCFLKTLPHTQEIEITKEKTRHI